MSGNLQTPLDIARLIREQPPRWATGRRRGRGTPPPPMPHAVLIPRHAWPAAHAALTRADAPHEATAHHAERAMLVRTTRHGRAITRQHGAADAPPDLEVTPRPFVAAITCEPLVIA